ncbi:hypothetical protein M426DRAFT_323965 [Hypoxylon sp. CI-4A]|nr:hypothetical protein M426DRAFT_323965 [Hypoxylon sp. CI-4A]
MPIVLIIGAGARIGLATARTFSAAGYKVVVASRSNNCGSQFTFIPFDAARPESVAGLFKKVHSDVGIPNVVIYNAYSVSFAPPDAPFDPSIENFQHGLNVNTTSPYFAAYESVKGFEKLGPSGLGPQGGTFMFTGNIGHITALPGLLAFITQKSASASMIQGLALASLHGKPYKFYHVDQRRENGQNVTFDLDGPAHGDTFLDLAQDPKQKAWDYTFARGKGYMKFPRIEVF